MLTLVNDIWSPPDVKASEDFPVNGPWWSRHLFVKCAQGIRLGLAAPALSPLLSTWALPPNRIPDRDGRAGEECRCRWRGLVLNDKKSLRTRLRRLRREHVAALPKAMSALLFLRPPVAVAALAAEGACVGLYHAIVGEAPTRGYAKWLAENGRHIALPWFADKDAAMEFRLWADPFGDEGLEQGPYGLQPTADAALVTPDLVFVPLVGFTADGQRLGQGGGHYDRWLAAHGDVLALGLAWDCQLVDSLPVEAHDVALRAIITPTRLYGDVA